MPESLVDTTWECLAYDEASCTPAGSGDIYRNVDVPVGGMLIYTIQAMRSPSFPKQTLVNTATIAPPASASDPDMTNNSDSAINTTFHVYLPIVRTPDRTLPVGPDLVVSEIQAASNGITLTIENQGNAPVSQPFWVDVYIDPDTAPEAVQQVWSDLGSQGLVWGIPESSLPFLSGESLTLSVGDAYYWPSLSHATWPLPAGTPVYGQVDSAGKHDCRISPGRGPTRPLPGSLRFSGEPRVAFAL